MKKFTVGLHMVFLALAAPGLMAETRGDILWYLEQEAGIEPYEVRYLVSRDYLRVDEGGDSSGYVLFDRGSKQIYNVVPEEQSILRIDGSGELPAAPVELSIEVLQSVDKEAPEMGGRSPLMLKLKAGNTLCMTAMVVPGYLSDPGAAMRQFAVALGVQQLGSLERYPVEYRTPCFLARSVYASDFQSARGLLLAEWDEQGWRRELLRVETDVVLDDTLFTIPQGLRTYKPEDVAE